MQRIALVVSALGILAGCVESVATPIDAQEPGVRKATTQGPADAPAGSCWGKMVSPAVIQTISEEIQVKPAKVNSDGSIAELPEFEVKERQRIVSPRKDNWFQTPCPDVLTEDFVASLQRALEARGYAIGGVTGKMNRRTRSAIQTLQSQQGLDSPVLSLETARLLGLVAIEIAPEAI